MKENQDHFPPEKAADAEPTETIFPESTSRMRARSRKRPSADGFHPVLILLHGLQKGARHRIEERETAIGRSKGAQIQVNDVGVSRRHALVIWENADRPAEPPRCFLEDLKSRNGTEINGKLINQRVALKERDRITVGRTTLVLVFREEDEIRHDQDLYHSATRDALTGLDNRQQLSYVLRHLLSSSSRRGTPLCLLVIDLDHFKEVNDSWGHQVGDQALRHVAGVILRCLRASDLACRWGGEEFVVVLPNTGKERAAEVAGRIRLRIAESPIVISGATINLTVSIGVAEARQSDSVQSLFDRGDERLYLAKDAGRNKVYTESDTEAGE